MELATWTILKLWFPKICSYELYLSCSVRGTIQRPRVQPLSFGHMLWAASHVSSNTLKTLSSLISHQWGGFYCSQEEGGCSLGFPFGSHLKAFWTYLQPGVRAICSFHLMLSQSTPWEANSEDAWDGAMIDTMNWVKKHLGRNEGL